MSALSIRPAAAADSADIESVVRESWLEANKNLIPADSQRALTNSRNLAGFVAGEWQTINVAVVNGDPVSPFSSRLVAVMTCATAVPAVMYSVVPSSARVGARRV